MGACENRRSGSRGRIEGKGTSTTDTVKYLKLLITIGKSKCQFPFSRTFQFVYFRY